MSRRNAAVKRPVLPDPQFNGRLASIIAFIGRKSSEEIVQVDGDVPEEVKGEKFSEVDGELICNACGTMFSPTITSCPACGTLKE